MGGRGVQANKTKGRRRNKRSLKWGTINAQSLINKTDLLVNRVGLHKLRIVSVTETWGKECNGDSLFALKGYKMYRSDRIGKEGGGTILYVEENIEQRSCRPLNDGAYESSAWCWIVEKGGKKILVGSIYRTPNSTPENDKLLLKKLSRHMK